MTTFRNPFLPGAGHMPPYLAGRETEKMEFHGLLAQDVVVDNLVLTGLRGVGKTVLLDTLKPIALDNGWLWAGNDLSEASSLTESNLGARLMTDLAVAVSSVLVGSRSVRRAGLTKSEEVVPQAFDFRVLQAIWDGAPGLASDKLKAVLEETWSRLERRKVPGVVFAYDEAQNLSDHSARNEFPIALLLDVFQSIQRKGIRFMLALAGLPTLFPKLVESRTFAERMFRVLTLDRLSEADCRDAVLKPVEDASAPVQFAPESVDLVYSMSKGYPYFIQYICREAFDIWTVRKDAAIPVDGIMRKLDADFFAGRWARATERQRDLLAIIAHLENAAREFTVQDIVEGSKRSPRPFGPSQVGQMLAALGEAGLVYKNRWGRYSLAVPLLDEFIRRQEADAARLDAQRNGGE